MVYQEGIKHFYELTAVLTYVRRKIRLLGSRCPSFKTIDSKISDQKNRSARQCSVDFLNQYYQIFQST